MYAQSIIIIENLRITFIYEVVTLTNLQRFNDSVAKGLHCDTIILVVLQLHHAAVDINDSFFVELFKDFKMKCYVWTLALGMLIRLEKSRDPSAVCVKPGNSLSALTNFLSNWQCEPHPQPIRNVPVSTWCNMIPVNTRRWPNVGLMVAHRQQSGRCVGLIIGHSCEKETVRIYLCS